MEALPRSPMLSFELKLSPEPVEFGKVLKQYIAKHYQEDPSVHNKACIDLEQLRYTAVQVSHDFTGCSQLKRYYSQLLLLEKRFPMGNTEEAAIPFTWEDVQLAREYTHADIKYEQACILYNIGALHSVLGAMDTRLGSEGMKVSCTHFQCAAWAFQHLRSHFSSAVMSPDMSHDMLTFNCELMLAQAQECILEKSITDNRKSSITAKVAVQIVEYLRSAIRYLDTANKDGLVNLRKYKVWRKRAEVKIVFYQMITDYYLGVQDEELQKWGAFLTYLTSAHERLQECIKLAKNDVVEIQETLRFALDVVGGKYNSAKKDNDFVYHEKLPSYDSLPEVKGASLVKGIPFDPFDPEVSGPDLFSKLVPITAHEAASLYSEEKAVLMRKINGEVEEKQLELDEFKKALNLAEMQKASSNEIPPLPDLLLEKCAAISARPDNIQDLIDVMGDVSGLATDVNINLTEISQILNDELQAETEFQAQFGKRSPNTSLGIVHKDLTKYEEAHRMGSQSNKDLHAAMNSHVTNLRLLSGPLDDLNKELPGTVDEKNAEEQTSLAEMTRLLDKLGEMEGQRSQLVDELREKIQSDDITLKLIGSSEHENKEIFKTQLLKFDTTIEYLHKNLAAQDKIMRAITETNAKCAGVRGRQSQLSARRDVRVAELIMSCDKYDDLLAKSHKGREFYRKLGTNVERLATRTHGIVKVESEEREAIRKKFAPKAPPPSRPLAPKPVPGNSLPSSPQPSFSSFDIEGPKLKDYLPFMKPATFGKMAADKSSARPSTHLPAAYGTQSASSEEAISDQIMSDSVGVHDLSSLPPGLRSVVAGFLPSPLTHAQLPRQPQNPEPPPTIPTKPRASDDSLNNALASLPAALRNVVAGFMPAEPSNAPPAAGGVTPHSQPTHSREAFPDLPSGYTFTEQPHIYDRHVQPSQTRSANTSTVSASQTRMASSPADQSNLNHSANASLFHPSAAPQMLFQRPDNSPGQSTAYPNSPTSVYHDIQRGKFHSVNADAYQQHMQISTDPNHDPSMTGYPGYSLQHTPQNVTQNQYRADVNPGIQPGYARYPQSESPSDYQTQHVPQQRPSVLAQQQIRPQLPQNNTPQQTQSHTVIQPRTSEYTSYIQTQQPPAAQLRQHLPQQPTNQQDDTHSLSYTTTHSPNQQEIAYNTQSNHIQPSPSGGQSSLPYLPQQPTQMLQNQQHLPTSQQVYQQQFLPRHVSVPINQHQSSVGTDPQQISTSIYQQSNQPILDSFHKQNQRIPPQIGQQYQQQIPTPAEQRQIQKTPTQIGPQHIPMHINQQYNQQQIPTPLGQHQNYQNSTQISQQQIPAPLGQYQNQQTPTQISQQQIPAPLGQYQNQHTPTQISQQQIPAPLGQYQNQHTPTQISQQQIPAPLGQYQNQHTPTQISQQQIPAPLGQHQNQHTPTQINQQQIPAPLGQHPNQQTPTQISQQQTPTPLGQHQNQYQIPGQQTSLTQHPYSQTTSTAVQPVSQWSNQPNVPSFGTQFQNQRYPAPASNVIQTSLSGFSPHAPHTNYNLNINPNQSGAGEINQAVPANLYASGMSYRNYSTSNESSTMNTSTQSAFSSQFGQSHIQNRNYDQQNVPGQPQFNQSLSLESSAASTQPLQIYAQTPVTQFLHSVSQTPTPSPAYGGQNAGLTSFSVSNSHNFNQSVAQTITTTCTQPHFEATNQSSQPNLGRQIRGGYIPANQTNPHALSQINMNAEQIATNQTHEFYPQNMTQQSAGVPQQQPNSQIQQPHQQNIGQVSTNQFARYNQQAQISPQNSPQHPHQRENLSQPNTSGRKIPQPYPNTSLLNEEMSKQRNPLVPMVIKKAEADAKSNKNGNDKNTKDLTLSRTDSNSLDDIFTVDQDVSKDKSEHLLTPKVLTAQDIQIQKDEALKYTSQHPVYKDPYANEDFLVKFHHEVERYQKFVNGLSTPKLSGGSPLENIWKEIREKQDRECRNHSIVVARCYVMKNRDPDVMPFDDNRVLLVGGGDDYINASWLDDLSLWCPKFIACQAPLPVTLTDFWLMVFEQGTEVIVNLSQENEAPKMPVYWPRDKGSKVYHGEVSLTLQSVKVKEVWTESLVYIHHSTMKQGRTVVHLQYLNWPISGQPDKTTSLVQFIHEVHAFYKQQRSLLKPVIVHCSNGVGRTGTFLTVYTGVQELNHGEGVIDIHAVIDKMRRKRKHMVGDKEQVKFCYQALLDHATAILMQRGIILKGISFGDKGPEKGHQKKKSSDDIFQSNPLPFHAVQSTVNRFTIKPPSAPASDTESVSSDVTDLTAESAEKTDSRNNHERVDSRPKLTLPDVVQPQPVPRQVGSTLGMQNVDVLPVVKSLGGSLKEPSTSPFIYSTSPADVTLSRSTKSANQILPPPSQTSLLHHAPINDPASSRTSPSPSRSSPGSLTRAESGHPPSGPNPKCFTKPVSASLGSSPHRDIPNLQTSSLPQSMVDLQDPQTFILENSVDKNRITKASFGKNSGFSVTSDDPNDPLSGLDPLWSMAKK